MRRHENERYEPKLNISAPLARNPWDLRFSTLENFGIQKPTTYKQNA